MPKAVQLVHGMPSEAASHRTCVSVMHCPAGLLGGSAADYSLSSRGMLRCVVVSSHSSGRPRCRGSSVEPYSPPTATSALSLVRQGIRGCAKRGLHLLSQALLARCRRNEGCPGGTDCDVADGLPFMSMCWFAARDKTYGVPMLGCAASGGGAVGAALAMKECSPDIAVAVLLVAVVES